MKYRVEKEQLKALAAMPADIRARAARVERLEKMLADGPPMVSDTVRGSTVGKNSILRTFVIRGVAVSEYDKNRARLRKEADELKRLNERYIRVYAEAAQALENVPVPEIRTALHILYMDGGTYEDVAGELGNTPEAWRKRLERWFEAHGDE